MKYVFSVILSLLILCSCSEEPAMRESVHRLSITFADAPESRSTWHDNTDSGGNAVYVWQSGTDMLTAIKHDGQYVPFYESIASPTSFHSPTQFETVDAERARIRLNTVLGVKYDVSGSSYVYPVAVGDDMYCCHPINEHTTISSSADDVHVDMHLSSSFDYNELSNDLSSLAEYSYVYTATTLQSVDDNDVVAVASHFNSACAILRFNITNNVSSDITISRVKVESDDGSPIFPDVLRFADGAMAEQPDKSGYYSRLTTNIASPTVPRTQTGTFYNMCFPLDADFNHAPLRFTIDTNYLTYRLKLDSDVITNNKFEAGKIYTFNFSLEDKEVRLNMIEIAQCTTYNIDSAESLNIIVSPDAVWEQSDHESAQMVFVSLGMTATIDGKVYEVLWATCNLGAMEPIETGYQYAWGEVTRKDPALYSPDGYASTASADIMGTDFDAVEWYLGGGHWVWCTPTKDMWLDIINNCEWEWKTVKKVADDSATEDNLDFDASVWQVVKKDADDKIVGMIYLPITGYTGYDDASKTYGRVNRARCQYWSSTPVGGVAGASERSWAFQTVYSTIVGSGDGDMSAPAMAECERYNGYSIRPVLLKERN